MATTKKALALADEIADALKKRMSLTVAQSFDTDGNPLIKVGTGTAGDPGGLLKIRPVDWPLAKDILGNNATMFVPHVAQLVTEANATAGAGADINTPAQLLPLLAEPVARGIKLEWYNSANGNAPDPTDISASNLKATYDSLYWPLMATQ